MRNKLKPKGKLNIASKASFCLCYVMAWAWKSARSKNQNKNIFLLWFSSARFFERTPLHNKNKQSLARFYFQYLIFMNFL